MTEIGGSSLYIQVRAEKAALTKLEKHCDSFLYSGNIWVDDVTRSTFISLRIEATIFQTSVSVITLIYITEIKGIQTNFFQHI